MRIQNIAVVYNRNIRAKNYAARLRVILQTLDFPSHLELTANALRSNALHNSKTCLLCKNLLFHLWRNDVRDLRKFQCLFWGHLLFVVSLREAILAMFTESEDV